LLIEGEAPLIDTVSGVAIGLFLIVQANSAKT
jgi:hypothetical protein